MSETIFDLFDLVFKYKNSNVTIIIDSDNIPWFSAPDVTKLLKYENTSLAISDHVDNKNKKPFSELKHYLKEIPPNSQPHAIYINEAGFYSLVFNSRKEVAKKFKQWVLDTVLPSIRQFGYYQLEQKYIHRVDNLNAKLKAEKLKNQTLENNQKKQKFSDGGLVYALEPMGITMKKKGKKIIRIGRSNSMNNRWNTYNTAVPDNFKLLYYIEVEDPVAVEHCIKSLLNKYRYRDNKDYYICPLSTLIGIFDGCNNLVKHKEFPFECTICNKRIISPNDLVDHFQNDHTTIIDTEFISQQIGGNIIDSEEDGLIFMQDHIEGTNEKDYHRKYLKYKQKYFDLKQVNYTINSTNVFLK
jgi:prophage antirepressor-like protein